MICPACTRTVEKLFRGGLCPYEDCKSPLKFIEKEVNGVPIKTLAFRKTREEVNSEDIEKYVTVYNADGVKIEKCNDGEHWIVSYYHRSSFRWIYCPSCESKMFQNNIVNGSIEHKCHKCKAITNYIFDAFGGV